MHGLGTAPFTAELSESRIPNSIVWHSPAESRCNTDQACTTIGLLNGSCQPAAEPTPTLALVMQPAEYNGCS